MEQSKIALEWHTERRRVNDLVPYQYNARKMTETARQALERSLQKFGLVEIPVINLDNTLLAGHQRCRGLQMLGLGEEEVDVRVPNRLLTDREFKEYNIASNAIKGDWLEDVLREHFSDIDLADVGLDLAQVDAILNQNQQAAAPSSPEPQYPITTKFSEKYDAYIIVTDNEIDSNHLRELLGIETERCYKAGTSIGTPHVIPFKAFIERWKSRS